MGRRAKKITKRLRLEGTSGGGVGQQLCSARTPTVGCSAVTAVVTVSADENSPEADEKK